MYRCPIMDSNEYMGKDDMYDWDDYDYPQYMYPPNMYRMCPMLLNSYFDPCMRCMHQQMNPATYSPDCDVDRPDREAKGYYKPEDSMSDLEEDESDNLKTKDKEGKKDDNSGYRAKIRTVDMSEIQD